MIKTLKFTALSVFLLGIAIPAAVFARGNYVVPGKVISGTISTISGNSITLAGKDGKAYTVDATNAKITKRPKTTIQISDLQTNDSIMVMGTITDTNVVAKTIIVNPAQTKNNTITVASASATSTPIRNSAFSGTVNSLGSNTFVLQTKSRGSQTVNTDSSTVFKKNGQAAQFSDLATGQNVMVSGAWDKTNSAITAKTINIIVRTQMLTGAASSISGNTFTLTTKDNTAYTVDTTNAKFHKRFGEAMSISDIQNGDTVQVLGAINDTNVSAKTVRDLSLQASSFNGTISALNGTNGFTLQTKNRGQQTVNLTSSTVINKNGQTASASDLATNQTIIVIGTWNSVANTITAAKVNIIIRMSAIRFTGTVQSVSGNMLTVATNATTSVTYNVDASKTIILYKGGRKGDISIVKNNDIVIVTGKHQTGSTDVTAILIRDTSQTYKNANSSSATSTNQ